MHSRSSQLHNKPSSESATGFASLSFQTNTLTPISRTHTLSLSSKQHTPSLSCNHTPLSDCRVQRTTDQHEVHHCRYRLPCCRPYSWRRLERAGPWYVNPTRINYPTLIICSQRPFSDHGKRLLDPGLGDCQLSAESGSCYSGLSEHHLLRSRSLGHPRSQACRH
jgi:hypothetical protein